MKIDIKNDMKLAIATGRSRKETSWRNEDMMWSELVRRLSQTVRTKETYSEYIALKKAEQDDIKDVGGFVGGFITGGLRKKGNIAFRSVITLDLDYAHMNMYDDFCMLYGYASCVYSTHKHTSKKPRLRLVIPLKNTVSSEQYEPIARKIAQWVGIDMFDDTTYQAGRLMYWPSTSYGADYYFDYIDCEFLDGDEVLAEYHDWHDVSSWPVSSRVDRAVASTMKKKQHPHSLKGVAGAFCRSYSIHEAIESYLSDVYTPCEGGRYTYIAGSTTAGLIVYDDVFCYSHHGTDPCSMQLVNAFDLVRIHRFGALDGEAQEGTPFTRLPSYKKMVELARADEKTKQLMIKEGMKSYHDEEKKEQDADANWTLGLEVNDKNVIQSTIDNVITVLENDPEVRGALCYNEFIKMVEVRGDVPWRKDGDRSYFSDTDESGLRHYLEKVYKITGQKKIEDALNLVTSRHAFHPIREYLSALSWDGVPRVERLFVDYLGADDSPYTRAVTRKSLAACVARVMKPGCKFDSVLTLVGKQGIGKSTLLSRLGGSWYNENVTLFNISKDTADMLQGSWLIELGELVGFRKAEVESVKNFISRTEDRYRKAYGKNTDIFPRQCVFFGTTNEPVFLRDPTGNRRWWPVETGVFEPCRDIFSDITPSEVAQIWAEAKTIYEAGEALYLEREVYDAAQRVQKQFNEYNEKTGMIEDYLEREIPENWERMSLYERREYIAAKPGDARYRDMKTVRRDKVCIPEVWCELFCGDPKTLRKMDSNEIANCLRQIAGWSENKHPMRFGGYGRQRGYVRGIYPAIS